MATPYTAYPGPSYAAPTPPPPFANPVSPTYQPVGAPYGGSPAPGYPGYPPQSYGQPPVPYAQPPLVPQMTQAQAPYAHSPSSSTGATYYPPHSPGSFARGYQPPPQPGYAQMPYQPHQYAGAPPFQPQGAFQPGYMPPQPGYPPVNGYANGHTPGFQQPAYASPPGQYAVPRQHWNGNAQALPKQLLSPRQGPVHALKHGSPKLAHRSPKFTHHSPKIHAQKSPRLHPQNSLQLSTSPRPSLATSVQPPATSPLQSAVSPSDPPPPSPRVVVTDASASPPQAREEDDPPPVSHAPAEPEEPSQPERPPSALPVQIDVPEPAPEEPPLVHTPSEEQAASSDPDWPTDGGGGWSPIFILSRPPPNPLHASGIIISPNAKPPENILRVAIPFHHEPEEVAEVQAPSTQQAPEVKTEPEVKPELESAAPEPKTETKELSPVQIPVPSTSTSETGTETGTEKTEATRPTSPASTNTSVEPCAPAAPAPAPPSAPAVKKSWAALLKQSPAPADGAAAGSRARIMASNVVGVSIPAEILTPPSAAATPSGSTPGPTTRPRRATLISLLNNYPAPPPTKSTGPVSFASAAAKAAPAPTLAPPPSRVVPRGLINTGNLCFANSVLQVLVVYCGALRGLLTALEPLLERDVALGEGSFPGLGENDFLGAGSGVKERESSTPVLDATIRLLREFLPSNKGKERAAESSAVNGDASGWSRVGKSGLEEEEEREAFMPTFVYDALMKKRRFGHLKLGQQEDAEEFLGFYLDELEEELESLLKDSDQQGNGIAGEVDGWTEVAKGKKNAVVRGSGPLHNSPISRIFGGTFRSTLHQPKKPDSVTVERWQRLMLDVEHESIDTIEDAIQRLVQPQPISDPASPTAQGPMMLQLQIASLPPVLVVHLKRFFYSADEVKKVSKEVRFGPILDFPANSNVLAKRTSAAKYRLFAVLYHHGRSAAGGHYTLDVLCPTRFALPSATQNAGKPGPPKAAPSVANKTGPAPQRFREGWIRIDDELVSDIRPEDVFGPGARSGGRWEEDGGRCAYLLFYERIG